MAYLINEEDRDLLETVKEFAEKEIKEQSKEWEKTGEVPQELYDQMAEMGLYCLEIPEENGGLGISKITAAALYEELAKADSGVAMTILATNLAYTTVKIAGNDEQKQHVADLIMEGKHGAFCLTEPSAGCDASNSKCTAVKDGDDYILNGRKCFITNGSLADWYVITAITDKSVPSVKGMSAFLVEKDLVQGLSSGNHEDKMGIRCSDTCDVVMEDVRVPASALLGAEGKGYKYAENDPSKFHGIGPFDCSTGKSTSVKSGRTYTEVFSNKVCQLAKKDRNIVAVTAAMADGTGLSSFKRLFPNRFFDVGIAEEHAVTFAAGMASRGMHPVVAIYSTFLQRAYDQIIHDVALGALPVTFAIDRAGIVGNDGETHQGIFDLSFLSHVPGLLVMAPKNANELEDMLAFSCSYNGPSAIRYPRGKATEKLSGFRAPIEKGKCEIIRKGKDAALFGVGRMVKVLDELAAELNEEFGYSFTVVNARFVNPIDYEALDEISKECDIIFTCEENVERGGYGEAVAVHLLKSGYRGIFTNLALPDEYIVQGSPNQIRDSLEFDPISLKNRIKKTVDEHKNYDII